MWIQDVHGNLINLSMVASITVNRNNPWNDDDATYRVVASTGTSNFEVDVVNATLLQGKSEDECKAFMERLTALLGDKVVKV